MVVSKEARSRGACWTCRLRRKKCDEASPECSACTSLAVPCFGYDKPGWADGGERQKAKAEELQIIIRELASLRRRNRKQRNAPGSSASKERDKDREAPSGAQLSDLSMTIAAPNERATTSKDQTTQDDTSSVSLVTLVISESHHIKKTVLPDCLEYGSQANLLMHYLDDVFPNQFPFYNPPSSDGGRGWLLLIILRTKPLYHAALSMATYHLLAQRSRERCLLSEIKNNTGGMLQTHHTLAIKELRHHLDTFREEKWAQSLEGNIEVLACIVFLISLEVFLGDTQSWQIHLRAAQNLLPGLQKGCRKYYSPSEPLSPSHVKGHQFFTSVIAWYDVLSTATTNLNPWAPPFCLDNEAAGFIKMETVMGCGNSAILAILQVASLNNWKVKARRAGFVDVSELLERANHIEKSLEEVLEQYSDCRRSELLLENEHSNSPLLDQNQQSRDLDAMSRRANIATITSVFACAALVYLNVVSYGFLVEHPKIHESVSQTVAALKQLHDRTALGILAWPLCIAGCMASDWQMEFFRNIFLEFENVSDVKSGNLKRSSLIIEECWRLRRDGMAESAGWQQAMESLNMKILLI